MDIEIHKCFVKSWTTDTVQCKFFENRKSIKEFDMHLFQKDKLFKGKNIYMEITIEPGSIILKRNESDKCRIRQLWNYYIRKKF